MTIAASSDGSNILNAQQAPRKADASCRVPGSSLPFHPKSSQRILPREGDHGSDRVHRPETETLVLDQIIGEDPAFRAVKRKLPLLACSDTCVLLAGETGTGKELCARAVHYLSPRAGKPFLPVNCGAIPAELFERELFGHEKGAFTGASTPSRGLVAEAEGGTLLLDEVETLSLSAQVKLLRFLEDQTYYALGSPRLRQGDVRIISATNADLPSKVQGGAFRQDLFYRLAVLTLLLPPLRERRTDIPLLVAHFWARYADQRGGQDRRLSPRAVEALCQYAWPGNVRELQNVLRQVAMLTEAQTLEPEDLPISPPPVPRTVRGLSLKQVKAEAIAQVENAYVTEMLRAHGGNVTRAAREAQMERRAFGRLIKKYRLAKS